MYYNNSMQLKMNNATCTQEPLYTRICFNSLFKRDNISLN